MYIRRRVLACNVQDNCWCGKCTIFSYDGDTLFRYRTCLGDTLSFGDDMSIQKYENAAVFSSPWDLSPSVTRRMEPYRSVAVACLTHIPDTWKYTLRMLLASCDLQAYLVFRDVENTLCTCRSAAVTRSNTSPNFAAVYPPRWNISSRADSNFSVTFLQSSTHTGSTSCYWGLAGTP